METRVHIIFGKALRDLYSARVLLCRAYVPHAQFTKDFLKRTVPVVINTLHAGWEATN